MLPLMDYMGLYGLDFYCVIYQMHKMKKVI